MKTIDQMRATLARAYNMDVSDKSDAFVEGFYNRSCESGVRLDADGNALGRPMGSQVDPDDHAVRAARGATSAVRNPSDAPDVSTMDLRTVKGVCLSIGTYSTSVRRELATAALARLRELGADQLADKYESLWDDDVLGEPSDAEANRAGSAHGDDDQAEGKRRLRAANQALLNSPSAARSDRTAKARRSK